MTIFATATPDLGSVLVWVVVGLVPGFLAARVYRGGRHGPAGDAAVGLAGAAGAVGGGTLAWAFVPVEGGMPLMGSLVAAALAATLVVLAIQWLGPQPRPAPRSAGT